MRVRLYLKKKKGGQGHPIYVALYSGDSTEIIYTGERLKLKDWNPKECAPRDHSSEAFQRIKKVEADVLKVMRLMEAQDKQVTPYALKREYEQTRKARVESQQAKDRRDKKSALTVSSLVDKWLQTGIAEYRPSTRKAISESLRQFREYIPAKLERGDLDHDHITRYAAYLDTKKLKDSTHGKRMKHLKWFLKWMVTVFPDGKINSVNQVRDFIKVRTIRQGDLNIFSLTLDELKALEEVPLDNRDHQRAKDMFLLGCYTSLRISDLKQISPLKLTDDLSEIHLTTVKTGRYIEIPLLAPAKEILSRYGWRAPRITADGKNGVNRNIKEVCKKAGIDRPIEKKSTRAYKGTIEVVPKYQVISSHVAGKTFISLAGMKWGLTISQVAKIVGKDVRTVAKHYLDPDREEVKKKILEAERKAAEEKQPPLMKVVSS